MVDATRAKHVLVVRKVSKSYGATKANIGVTVSCRRGEVFGLLGPNGAGKTTLVRQITGLAKPDAGDIAIEGRSVVADPDVARGACSVQPQASIRIDNLRPIDAIQLVGRMRGASRHVAHRRALELLAALDIESFARSRANSLSGGVVRLVSFAMAVCEPGVLVILDEPTNDVDPVRRRLLWDEVRKLADAGSAVLLVTHNILEAERIVDRVAILDRGRVVRSGTPKTLRHLLPEPLMLEIAFDSELTLPLLPPFLKSPVMSAGRLRAAVADVNGVRAMRWVSALKRNHAIETFTIEPASLDDVYTAVVSK